MENHPIDSVTLKRRALLAASAASLATLALPAAASSAAPEALAEAAAIWGIPLVRTGRYFALAQAKNLAVNQFYLN